MALGRRRSVTERPVSACIPRAPAVFADDDEESEEDDVGISIWAELTAENKPLFVISS